MTKEELVKEVLNMRKFNYALTPDEVFLEILKAINTEPISHGHWITKALSAEQSIDDLPRLISKCSVCGKKLQFVTLATQMPYKYCPNCGARMDGEENG